MPSRVTEAGWVGGWIASPAMKRRENNDKSFFKNMQLMLPYLYNKSLVLSCLVPSKSTYSLLLFNSLHSDRQFKAEQRNKAISTIIPVQ